MKKRKSESQTPDTLTKTQKLIVQECDYIKQLLLEKNESYADSFSDPLCIFAKNLSPGDQIRSRIDDKLKRIKCGKEYKEESTTEDLIGYLILLRVQQKL